MRERGADPTPTTRKASPMNASDTVLDQQTVTQQNGQDVTITLVALDA